MTKAFFIKFNQSCFWYYISWPAILHFALKNNMPLMENIFQEKMDKNFTHTVSRGKGISKKLCLEYNLTQKRNLILICSVWMIISFYCFCIGKREIQVHMHAHTCTHTHMHTSTYTHMHASTHTHALKHVHTCTQARTHHAHKHVHTMHASTHTPCTQARTHMHASTHTHTHTHTRNQWTIFNVS